MRGPRAVHARSGAHGFGFQFKMSVMGEAEPSSPAIAFVKRGLLERERLFIAGDRQNPQVPARLRIEAAKQQNASIGRPIG